jgi:hypothetical protein
MSCVNPMSEVSLPAISTLSPTIRAMDPPPTAFAGITAAGFRHFGRSE